MVERDFVGTTSICVKFVSFFVFFLSIILHRNDVFFMFVYHGKKLVNKKKFGFFGLQVEFSW